MRVGAPAIEGMLATERKLKNRNASNSMDVASASATARTTVQAGVLATADGSTASLLVTASLHATAGASITAGMPQNDRNAIEQNG